MKREEDRLISERIRTMRIWQGGYQIIEITQINGTIASDANNLAYEILEEDIGEQLRTKGPLNAVLLLDADPTSNGLVSFQRESQMRGLIIREISIGEIVEVEVLSVAKTLIHVACGQSGGLIRDFRYFPLTNDPPDQWIGRKFMVEKIGPRVGLGHHFSARRVNFEKMLNEIVVGAIYTGVIKNLVAYGAFVRLSKFGYDTLLHKTNMNSIENHLDLMTVGDEITVSILSIERDSMEIKVSLVGF